MQNLTTFAESYDIKLDPAYITKSRTQYRKSLITEVTGQLVLQLAKWGSNKMKLRSPYIVRA